VDTEIPSLDIIAHIQGYLVSSSQLVQALVGKKGQDYCHAILSF